MTFLPIVERELRVAARLTATYRNRSLVVAIMAMIAVVMLLFGFFSRSPSSMGSSMFAMLSWMTLIICLLEGSGKTADCLSGEKREGTLGLLFLTDLKGYDVILGKLAAVSLKSVYGLFSILPVLALPLLLGGVLPGEFWRVSLALMNALFFSLCVGMLTSCWFRERNATSSWSTLLVGAMALLPLLARRTWMGGFSPVYAFYSARAMAYRVSPGNYWMSLCVVQLMSWAVLGWASWIAPYCWREEKTVAYSAPVWKRSARAVKIKREFRNRMLDTNPVTWLALRSLGSPAAMYSYPVAAGLISALTVMGIAANYYGLGTTELLPLLLGLFVVLNFLMKFQVARIACRFFAQAKQNNAMEMLLSTPLTVERIVDGQWRALKRYFVQTVMILFGVEMLGALLAVVAMGMTSRPNMLRESGNFIALFGGAWVYFLYYIFDAIGVAWAGIWFGLSAKSESAAVNRTVLLAIAVPTFSLGLCYIGLPVIIGAPLFWIAWGSSKVRAEFRRLAAQQYAPPKDGWGP